MLNWGIYDASQLKNLRANGFLARRRRFALDLATEPEVSGDTTAKNSFVESIVDSAGVYKRTYEQRFPEFDQLLLEQIGALPGDGPFHLLDVAVSDGSTAADLFEKLVAGIHRPLTYTATDRDAHYKALSIKGGSKRRIIIDHEGRTVQIVFPPFVFGTRATVDNVFLFPLNRIFRPMAMEFGHKVVALWRAGDRQIHSKEFSIICRRFRNLISTDPRIVFLPWDIRSEWTGRTAQCVRAMNVINPEYFSGEDLITVLGNLVQSVAEGGLLAIGSNEGPNSVVHGAIYKKLNGRLTLLRQSGDGPPCGEAIHKVGELPSDLSVDGGKA